MYLDYFSLTRHPFRITPDPSLFFPGGVQGRGVVLDALVYGITSGEGILKVVGEVGSGKTMLCRMLEEKLPDTIKIVYLANPSLSARDIIYAIAIELEMAVDAATDRLRVMHELQQYLLAKHAEGGSVVVFIEEAQSMPLETLEEIRLLSNLETHRHKLMQIVLFGQPELDKKLADKSIRQLKERITHSFYLSPLNQEETSSYLHFRLQAAGCPWPQLFSPKAEKMLAKASAGLTRRINILADKALLASYADPAARPQPRNTSGEIQSMVLPRHVKIAVNDSNYRRLEPGLSSRWLEYGVAAFSGAVLVAALGWWFGFAGFTGDDSTFTDSAVFTDNQLPVASLSTPIGVAPVAESVEASTEEITHNSADPEVSGSRQSLLTGAQQMDNNVQAEVELAVDHAEPSTLNAQEADRPQAVLAKHPPPASTVQSTQSEDRSRPEVTDVVQGDSPQVIVLTTIMQERLEASKIWLAQLDTLNGYSVQLSAFPSAQTSILEGFIARLDNEQLLPATYLCLISATDTRPEQWLVLHGEFSGVSMARTFIAGLPEAIAQYGPYVRNISGIACSNNKN